MTDHDRDPGYTISIDTGGTFTDVVVADEERVLGLFKAPTTPNDLFQGITAALEIAGESLQISIAGLLGATRVFVYSTTASTNAVLTGNIARTAFVTTKGYRDVLLYREGGKDNPFNLSAPTPEPYVPRRLCFELTERVLADGSVAVQLDDDEVRSLLRRLAELKVGAIGVCLIFSVMNPAHELRVGALIKEILPGVEYSLSHKVNNTVREYRRASSTVIDASIKPLMRAHLAGLDEHLRKLGFHGEPLMVTHVSGGVMGIKQICERPIHSVDSGPALAPIAALQIVKEEPTANTSDLIVVDSGGTSFDVSLTHRGDILYTREKWLGPKWRGHMTGLPAIDTQSIGAGGGSIAYIDAGGLLRVGPQSAGAEPGPVCYGHGGTQPTVTDAAVVLGYIDPEYFLGGRMVLDLPSARASITECIATPLGLTVEVAAEAILRIASESMRGFITDMTVFQGRDPRECLLVAGGGAAGLNIVRIARDLGIRQIIVPRLAAGLSALGGQFSDISISFSSGQYLTSADFNFEVANRTFAELDVNLDAFLDLVNSPGERRKRFTCEARYEQQLWEIDVSLGEVYQFKSSEDVAELRRRFDKTHKNLFAVDQPGTPIEIVTCRGEGRIIRNKPRLSGTAGSPKSADGWAAIESRIMWFAGAPAKVAVYRVGGMPPRARIAGPAVIEEPATTIVLDPGSAALVHPSHYLIDVRGDSNASTLDAGERLLEV